MREPWRPIYLWYRNPDGLSAQHSTLYGTPCGLYTSDIGQSKVGVRLSRPSGTTTSSIDVHSRFVRRRKYSRPLHSEWYLMANVPTSQMTTCHSANIIRTGGGGGRDNNNIIRTTEWRIRHRSLLLAYSTFKRRSHCMTTILARYHDRPI